MPETYKEVPKEKEEIIGSVIRNPPAFKAGWLSFFPVGSEFLFDNPKLSEKVIAAGIWVSGSFVTGSAVPYAYEVVRQDGDNCDVDRYLLSISGSAVLIRREIEKDFLEHHSSGLPYYYN